MTITALQQIFDHLNEAGCWLGIYWPDGDYTRIGVQAHFEITRVTNDETAVWVTLWSVGYQEGWQYVHTIKVVRRSSDDPPLEIDLVDERGRQFHIEAIEETTEPDEAAVWQAWKTFREHEQALFASIDATLREEHLQIAASWPEE